MQHCNIKLSQTACSALKHPVDVVISLGTRDDESMRGRSGGFGRLRLRWGMRERISDFQTRREGERVEWSQNTQPSPVRWDYGVERQVYAAGMSAFESQKAPLRVRAGHQGPRNDGRS